MSNGEKGWWSLANAAKEIAKHQFPKNAKKRAAFEKVMLERMQAAAASGELKTRVNH